MILLLTGCLGRETQTTTGARSSVSATAMRENDLRPLVCGDRDGEGGSWKPIPYRSDGDPGTQLTNEDTAKTVNAIRANNCRQAKYCGLPLPPNCKK